MDSRKILQDKEEIKETLGRSPNNADAYVLTYAYPVMKTQFNATGLQQGRVITGYAPYS
ncbi:TPA: hypothetical protein ACPUVD_004184 [Klebsiella pneumoniae]|uniref:hypothetical protein n=1 Tax=Klebsiella pneumoniae TaxID=573 RepID=UPI0024AEEEF6|nr:hypothetical protein [Klebsiella pneumoniae]MDI7146352.1 hypothetical protein [Klebsiella pneumoniae]